MIKSNIIFNSICFIIISANLFCGQPKYIENDSYKRLTFLTNDTINQLNIPERPDNALKGSEFVHQITHLSIIDREKAVIKEILSGNVPSFSRNLKPLKFRETVNAKTYELIFYTTCDYMAIGSDKDYLYIPMTPSTAQYLADQMHCSLPTSKMVDIIYNKSNVKLEPQPIPPSDKMITVPVFNQHTDSIRHQIDQTKIDRSSGISFAGHKKDIIISNKIYHSDNTSNRVVIYGWHLEKNKPIQPVYNGHIAAYVDYSHGARFISESIFINGKMQQIEDILKDSGWAKLLSDEGVINKPYYPKNDTFHLKKSKY